jgi:hypothetical protein
LTFPAIALAQRELRDTCPGPSTLDEKKAAVQNNRSQEVDMNDLPGNVKTTEIKTSRWAANYFGTVETSCVDGNYTVTSKCSDTCLRPINKEEQKNAVQDGKWKEVELYYAVRIPESVKTTETKFSNCAGEYFGAVSTSCVNGKYTVTSACFEKLKEGRGGCDSEKHCKSGLACVDNKCTAVYPNQWCYGSKDAKKNCESQECGISPNERWQYCTVPNNLKQRTKCPHYKCKTHDYPRMVQLGKCMLRNSAPNGGRPKICKLKQPKKDVPDLEAAKCLNYYGDYSKSS